MVNYLRPKKQPWWLTGLKMAGWLLLVCLLGLAGLWLHGFYNGNIPAWIWVLLGMTMLNYAANTLGDRLDAILWTLEDIRERLPEPPSDHDYP